LITKQFSSTAFRFSIEEDDKEVARGYLFIITNDQEKGPYGLMEDVFVDDSKRGQGYGTKILNKLIQEAKNQNCYKLIGTSRNERPKVHELYLNLGFKDYGKEFRMDL